MGTFVVSAIFKNETMNLKEWLEHYIWQGASHFFLVDNGSTDNPLDILNPYIEKGLVSYLYDDRPYIQFDVNKANTQFIQSLPNPPDWILIADLDEFWFGTTTTLKTTLETIPEQIYLIYSNWIEFGPSESGFQPESLRKELVKKCPSLLSPKFCFRVNRIKPPSVRVHEVLGIEAENTLNNTPLIRCHHYALQSREYWWSVKIPRGHAMGDLSIYERQFFEKEPIYTVIDTTLADLVKKYETEQQKGI